MDDERILLGDADSKHGIRPWLAARVLSPLDAVTDRGTVAYGSVENPEALWLGVARPGRLRAAQFLFRGHLVQEEGSWSLVGRMTMPTNVVVRIAMLAVFGVVVCGVSVKFLVAGGQLAVMDLVGFMVGVCMVGGALLVHRAGVSSAQNDFDWLREHLGRTTRTADGRRPEPADITTYPDRLRR